MREDTRTLVFAGATCLVVSLLLSGTAAGLKSRITANEEFDVKRNIVKAFGVNIAGATPESINETFEEHISEMVVDASNGTLIEGMLPKQITPEAMEAKTQLPLYTWTENGEITRYAIPISGKGLWSMLHGYLSLESDLQTIAGITFYKHGETPGLGAEIEKDWFQNQFRGKKLYEDGAPTEFKVAKPDSEKDGPSEVDGISGATLTGKGVQDFLRKDAASYADYFNSIKEGK